MAEFKIVDLHDIPAIDPARQGKQDKLVTYELSDGRRRLLRVPAEGVTEAKIVDAIKKELGELKAIIGKTYPH